MSASRHWDIGDRDNWSTLMLTEMLGALVLFLAVIAGVWVMLATWIG